MSAIEDNKDESQIDTNDVHKSAAVDARITEEDPHSSASVKTEPDIESSAEADGNLRVVMALKSFEPPAFISSTKTYEQYKDDLYMWSRITSVPRKQQAEVIVYNLGGHESRIKEKIMLNIREKIKDENGIEELVTFLDSIYKADEMADAWAKYKGFQKVSRNNNTSVNDFMAEFDKEYLLAKSAGCVYSDTILGFRLLECTNVNEIDEKFVLTGIDFAAAKEKSDLYDQMKKSLKKFQGREIVSTHEKSMQFDPTLIATVTEVLLTQGWKKPGGRRRSNTDPGPEGEMIESKRNSSFYKGKKNPLGPNGKPKLCFKCQSEYHLADRCQSKGVSGYTAGKASRQNSEYGMVTTSSDHKFQDYELVMIVDRKEQLCFMVAEAGLRAVIDSACSKTVAGVDYINRYVNQLSEELRHKVI